MNKRILLAKRPEGLPTADTWQLDIQPVPSIEEGEILVRNHYVSLDPAMRIWVTNARSYLPPVQLGDVMRAGTVGEVVESRDPRHPVGTFVQTWGGAQQYSALPGKQAYRVDPSLAPLTSFIGGLGMTGMTAYFGILEEGRIQAGETVLVSGGAGAVGSVAGQIAKIKGCRVVGVAGGPEKCRYMKEELGFDGAIDYKSDNLFKAVRRECPEGIDVYFDNVGGDMLDIALANLRMHARVLICGAISQYNEPVTQGPKFYLNLINMRASMKGFLVLDYASRYAEAAKEMAGWMAEGKLRSHEDVYVGIEQFHDTFLRLFSGDKHGKVVLKVLE